MWVSGRWRAVRRFLGGAEGLDCGGITRQRGIECGYLPQDGLSLSGRSVFAECLSVFSHVHQMQREGIAAWVRERKSRVLLTPEMTYAVPLLKTLLFVLSAETCTASGSGTPVATKVASTRQNRSTAIRCGTWLASLLPATRSRRKSLKA